MVKCKVEVYNVSLRNYIVKTFYEQSDSIRLRSCVGWFFVYGFILKPVPFPSAEGERERADKDGEPSPVTLRK